MTWEIISALIVILGAIISIGKIIANNTAAMTQVRCAIDSLTDTVKEQKHDISELRKDVDNIKLKIR